MMNPFVIIAIAFSKAKKYANQFLTTGATPKGSWDASTNTPTLVNGSGTQGWYYDVIVGGTQLGYNFLVGDRVIYADGKWQRVATGVEQDNIPMVIAFIDQNTAHLPVQRTSGKSLITGDWVEVKSSAILNPPITIDGITFDSYSDKAVWNGTVWQEQSYTAGKTNEVAVNSTVEESISGLSQYQSEINKEVKTKITDITSLINSLDEEYKKAGFTFTATTDSSSGIDITTLNVKDKEDNELLSVDLTGAMTPEELSAAIKDLPEELTNKIIDCGSFNPVP